MRVQGTVSALFQSNITPETALISYLQAIFFRNATTEEVAGLVATYPKNRDTLAGVGASNSTYPEFKRLAAILGNWEFILMSRLLLETFPADVPASSYSAAYGRGASYPGQVPSRHMSPMVGLSVRVAAPCASEMLRIHAHDYPRLSGPAPPPAASCQRRRRHTWLDPRMLVGLDVREGRKDALAAALV
ncbi:hypothetical protein CHGG_09356 [Chaetomium globosum CBS 148.51]|uniref:Uncharacterized protein n=1 Tax=Chaetomium globosum (strain ATCC 6205 / CBS 148.51 / DSM 1962 / NBRC 6347 / NRRL 1970) TaxID=306901 RepID=Q2GRP8_CHAGB|nr:uncharacterized protein CHGG_09356 [Chaetomium globosum CBS 148.51]EAQ85342.1 hypothetical protein CHGG_09356 [Chaetomium globosum CBS 148.51]